VSTRITIEISRAQEASSATDLCVALQRQTGVLWAATEMAISDGNLGVFTIILEAVITATAEQSAQLVVAEAKKVLHGWREQHLDPPEAQVTIQEIAEDEPADARPDEP
jgi:hypothetical protein